VIADGGGRAVAFSLAPGQAHELPMARALLSRLPETPTWVVADCGCTSHALREHLWSIGASPAIPPQRHEAPVACPPWIYHNRNRVLGAAQKNGGLSPHATRRLLNSSWVSSALPPRSIGSGTNGP